MTRTRILTWRILFFLLAAAFALCLAGIIIGFWLMSTDYGVAEAVGFLLVVLCAQFGVFGVSWPMASAYVNWRQERRSAEAVERLRQFEAKMARYDEPPLTWPVVKTMTDCVHIRNSWYAHDTDGTAWKSPDGLSWYVMVIPQFSSADGDGHGDGAAHADEEE